MAEAVHSTEMVAGRPSLFELVAADGLLAALLPAARHCCQVMLVRYPSCKWLLETHLDEFLLVINVLVQKHYLRTYGGSLAEHFYGVKRVATATDSQSSDVRLSAAAVRRSLLALCLLPYAKEKLDRRFEELQHEHASHQRPDQKRWQCWLQTAILRLYPLLHALFCLSMAGHHLAYLLELADHHSPLTRLARLRLAAVTEADLRRLEVRHARLADWRHLRKRASLPRALCLWSGQAARRALGPALQLGSFLVQCVQWWRDSELRAARRLGQVEVPPPVAQHSAQVEGAGVPSADCPLCGKHRTSEAVLSVSGHVFCHVCIYRHVNETGRCPVTWYPASTDQIYRLYPPDN